MTTYLKVKDSNDLVRDESSKAILNTDNDALTAYKRQKKKDKMIEDLADKYANIHDEVCEIKQLLRNFIEKNSK